MGRPRGTGDAQSAISACREYAMSAGARSAARRLACYLCVIGIHPELTGRGYRQHYRELLTQYTVLPPLVRREARRQGRLIIRDLGLDAAAARLFPATLPLAPRTLQKSERSQQLASLFSQSPGRCPSCKSRERAKRSWPNREVAEAFRLLTGDLSLHVYECPAAHPGTSAIHGTYHLGHAKNPGENNNL